MVTARLSQEQEANGDNAYAVNVEARDEGRVGG